MNVAALLQDSPSEDTNNRRRPPDNPSQRAWPPPSSPSQPSSTTTSSWGPTSSSGIHDWKERDTRLSNPTLVGPGTGVPPSPYIQSDEKTPRSPSHSQSRSDPSRRTSGDADHVMRENRQRADGPPPPGFYSGPQRDRDREREQRDRVDMDIIRAVASSRPTPTSHAHHHVHSTHSHQQQHSQHQQHQHVHVHSHQHQHTSTTASIQSSTSSSGPAQSTQPQKQFQHQFHTQFVSGLTVGNKPPSPVVDAVENKKERDGRRSGGGAHHQQQQVQDMHRRQGSHSHHSHGLVGYAGDGRERERGADRDRDRDRGIERDRDRERQGMSQQHPPHHHPQAHQYRIPPPPPPLPLPPHHSHPHPHQPNHHQHPPHPHPQQHHSNQQQQHLSQRKELDEQPHIVNAPSHSGVTAAPSGHLRPPVYDSEHETSGAQNVGTAGPGLDPNPGSAGSNDNPPSINPSTTLIDDWDVDIAIEEESRSWNRARVSVHLGTFVFPKLPFPYFFELGSGLFGVKDREEERDRVEKERSETERREREGEEREKDEREKAKKKANGENVKEDDDIVMKIEEGEIIERVVDEKGLDKTSETEKKDRGIEIQPHKDDSQDISISIQRKVDSPLSIRHQQDPLLPQPPLLDIETRTTIIIPTGYIPAEKPLRPKLWGGGGFDPRPRPPPLRSRRSKNGGLNGKGRQHQPHLQSRPSSTKPSLLSASANTSLNSSSSSNNPTLPPSSSQPQTRTRRPRRIYTDDSDIFLCTIHSGWVTWSGARKARLKGRDMRIEVRMMRCAGVGGGIESLGDSGEGECERRVKEEMIGRFVGGYGERCFNPLGKSGRVTGEEGDGEEEEEEEGAGLMLDDPDDDGRSLVSAAWGSGHDGSAIEIVNVEFVEKGTARSACGLGRRNRSQRLLEYAERRASVLGHPCTSTFGRLAGRKRRRAWDACSWPVYHPRRLPNATVLDVIQEAEEEEEEGTNDRLGCVKGLRVQEEDRLMDVRTMVFGMGSSGDLRVGYRYVPSVLKEILFPSLGSSSSDQPPPRKRRRTQENEDVEMENADNNIASTSFVPCDTLRPVILETVKESYLLSPGIPLSSSSMDARETYDIALILEADVVVEEEPPLAESERNIALDATKPVHVIDGPSTTEKTEPSVPSAQSKTSDAVPKPVEPSSSPPTDSLTLDDENTKPQFTVQVLQRNLTEDMFRFVDEGVYVKEDGDGSMETEWVIQVKDWKWRPKERI